MVRLTWNSAARIGRLHYRATRSNNIKADEKKITMKFNIFHQKQQYCHRTAKQKCGQFQGSLQAFLYQVRGLFLLLLWCYYATLQIHQKFPVGTGLVLGTFGHQSSILINSQLNKPTKMIHSFIHSFIRGGVGRWQSFDMSFILPPAMRPRHGPVRNSPLTLGLVLYVYRA